MASLPPGLHAFPDGVDQLKRNKLLLQNPLLRPARSGFQVITRWPTAFLEHRLPFFVSPVARGFLKGRVEDGVVNEHGPGYLS
ncbi:hypothetical protein HRbin36_01831 [bacterium HR36]|nr:hypothetical protein HRbin36_01831 [bacterium HR36]